MTLVMLGRKIEVPNYTTEQAEIWVDRDCPTYTGIMAAINGIAFEMFGCFSDGLTKEQREIVHDKASRIGLAWFEMPDIPTIMNNEGGENDRPDRNG